MTRARLIGLLTAVFILQAAWATFTQTSKPPGPLRTEAVADGLYLVTGEGGNVALLVTGEGVLLVDNMFDRNHEGILAEIAALTDQPLRYVINTHQHDDHAGGDFRMLPIAEVIAHRNVRANLADLKQPYYEDTPGTPIGLPRVTFERELAVHLDGREVQAHYFGRGHTSGDAVIAFPDLGIIHTGDLFLSFGRGAAARDGEPRPRGVNVYVDYVQGGSFLEWSETLDAILGLQFDRVIPGHGPVATRADLVRFKEDLETMRARLQALLAAGTSRADFIRILEDDYGWRSTGCPERPPTAGCLQYQQVDALIAELGPAAPPAGD